MKVPPLPATVGSSSRPLGFVLPIFCVSLQGSHHASNTDILSMSCWYNVTISCLTTYLRQCDLMGRHIFYKRCNAIALLQSTHKQRALEPKCQKTTDKARTIDGVTKTILYMVPPFRTSERDPLNPMAYEQKKTRSVTDLNALTS